MDVAITGSNGLIGRALAASLRADGHRVLPVVRPSSRGKPSGGADPTITWDPAAGSIDAGGLEGLDAVVHLAGEGIGEKRWTPEQKRVILESRTTGTSLLASALAGCAKPPPVMVSGSAIGYYGDRGNEVLTESSAPGTGFLAEICEAWEGSARPAVDAGIRVAFARTGIVLSKDGGALPQLLPLFKLFLGGKMGSGAQWMSWISIDDEVGALRWLLDHDVAGPVNLVAPNPVTNAELSSILGEVLHRPSFLPVPAFGPRLLKGKELADQLLFASQRVEPSVLVAGDFPFRHTHLADALRAVL